MAKSETYTESLKRYEAVLARKEGEIGDLRLLVATLRKLAEREEPAAEKPKVTLPPLEPDARLGNVTMEEAAIIALEKVGRPLRIREIFDALQLMGYKYPKGFDVFKDSVSPTLRTSPRISRPERGLFALASWGKPVGSPAPSWN